MQSGCKSAVRLGAGRFYLNNKKFIKRGPGFTGVFFYSLLRIFSLGITEIIPAIDRDYPKYPYYTK